MLHSPSAARGGDEQILILWVLFLSCYLLYLPYSFSSLPYALKGRYQLALLEIDSVVIIIICGHLQVWNIKPGALSAYVHDVVMEGTPEKEN